MRKDPAMLLGAAQGTIRRLAALQRRLVARAYELLRPGGVLVYSTCTLAPEENEAVVAGLLESTDAVVEPVAWPTVLSPGLIEWEGDRFPASLQRAARIYPHEIDSGGGFCARLCKP
jgi:16S rRNA C967 or C1407 C5-methylase (RsmB/RsmF family)